MKTIWVCLLLLGLVACSAPNQSSAVGGSSADAYSTNTPRAPSTRSEDNLWQFEIKDSPMDGELVQATRAYKFPAQDTSIQAEFVCTVKNNLLQIRVTSIVGDQAKPSKASQFQRDGSYVSGRVRFSSFPPEDLYNYFAFDNFGNVILDTTDTEDTSSFAIVIGKFEDSYSGATNQSNTDLLEKYLKLKGISTSWVPHYFGPQVDSDGIKFFKFNSTAALSNLFPIAIEVLNGNGTFDFVINKSSSISKVLDRCGGNGTIMDPTLQELLKSGPAGSTHASASLSAPLG